MIHVLENSFDPEKALKDFRLRQAGAGAITSFVEMD